jgi:hypothetical protein
LMTPTSPETRTPRNQRRNSKRSKVGYQEALLELIEAKMKGLTVKPKEITAPPPVIALKAALKRSLAQELRASKRTAAALKKPNKTAPDRRQPALFLPVAGGRKRKAVAEEPTSAAKRHKRA